MSDGAVIHRVSLEIKDEQRLRIHGGGKLLAVAPDRDGLDRIDLWYTTYPANPHQYHDRPIYIAGTGHREPPAKYVGTAVMPSGLVFHVFEGLGFLS